MNDTIKSHMDKLRAAASSRRLTTAEIFTMTDPVMNLLARHETRYERMHDGMHKIHGGDGSVYHIFNALDHGDPHDHPWPFRSEVLFGGYVEQMYNTDDGTITEVERLPGHTFDVPANRVHKIVHLPTGLCITRIWPGEHVQTPGFWRWTAEGAQRRNWDGDWYNVG